MMICPECNGTGKTVYFEEVDRDENSVTCEKREGICRTCNGSGEKPMTNGDKIRAMSDKELASLLSRISIVAKRMSEAAYLTLTQQAALQSHEYMYWRRYLSETVEDK